MGPGLCLPEEGGGAEERHHPERQHLGQADLQEGPGGWGLPVLPASPGTLGLVFRNVARLGPISRPIWQHWLQRASENTGPQGRLGRARQGKPTLFI